MGVAQGGSGPALIVDFCGALRAQRQVVCGPQVCAHPQLTVDESRDRFGGQVFGGAELPRRADRGIALGRELSGEPGERATEHMFPVRHHQLL